MLVKLYGHYDYGSRIWKKRPISVCFRCAYTRFVAENAFKRTKKLKNERFTLSVGNPDCHPYTPTYRRFHAFLWAFTRVFDSSCLLGSQSRSAEKPRRRCRRIFSSDMEFVIFNALSVVKISIESALPFSRSEKN